MKFTRVARVKGSSTLGMLSLAAAAVGPSASSTESASSSSGSPRPRAAILAALHLRRPGAWPPARSPSRPPSPPARAGPAGDKRGREEAERGPRPRATSWAPAGRERGNGGGRARGDPTPGPGPRALDHAGRREGLERARPEPSSAGGVTRWGTRPGTRGGWGPRRSHGQAGNEGLGHASTWGQPERGRLPATPRPRGNHCAVLWSTRSYPVVSNSLAVTGRQCGAFRPFVQSFIRLCSAPLAIERDLGDTDRQHAKGQAPRKSGMRSAEVHFVPVVLSRRGTRVP